MGGQIYATLGVSLSLLLALSWSALLSLPVNWLRYENMFAGFEVSLWQVCVRKGLGTSAVNAVASWGLGKLGVENPLSKALNLLMDQCITVDDAKAQFCAIRIPGTPLDGFCYMWEKVWYGSWACLIAGYIAVVFFVIGAIAMQYYASSHATETGRLTTKFMFTLAPLFVFAGIGAFIFATHDFGKGLPSIIGSGSQAYWGPGFMISAALVPLSFIPLYVQAVFGKVARDEKKRGEYDDDDGEAGQPISHGQQEIQYGASQNYVPQPYPVQQPQQWTAGPSVPTAQYGGQPQASTGGPAW